jgi:dihydroorotase
MESRDGILLKVNPPLRPLPVPSLMMRKLLDGEIDWVETDHAPHTRADKLERFASGFPGFAFLPRFIGLLSERGLSRERIEELTHGAVCRAFGIRVPASGRRPEPGLEREYEFDAFSFLERPRAEAP